MDREYSVSETRDDTENLRGRTEVKGQEDEANLIGKKAYHDGAMRYRTETVRKKEKKMQ